MQPAVIYLHGFVSGPNGAKVNYLMNWLARRGLVLHRPDLNTPDFEHMTITAMVEKAAAEVAAASSPVTLIGSSLGGYTALQFMQAHRGGLADRVERLILLAPALDFPARFIANAQHDLGPDVLAAWQAAGSIPMYHHAHEKDMPLGHWFVEDLANWSDAFDVELALPTLIIHGMLDESVPYTLSARFAEGKPNVQLHLLGSGDHGMLDWLDLISAQIGAFLKL